MADGAVYVAFTLVPRLVRIAIDEYGSAETPELLVAPAVLCRRRGLPLGGSPLSLVFGTGKGSRQDLFVDVVQAGTATELR